MYNILESIIEFKNGKLDKISVLINVGSPDCPDVRAIFASSRPCSGYKFILPSDKLTEELLQQIAGSGMEIEYRDKIFKNWKKKYFKNK